jgi:hypothetical protein
MLLPWRSDTDATPDLERDRSAGYDRWVMYWLGFAMPVSGLIAVAFWLIFAIAPDSAFAQKRAQRLEEQVRQRKAEGYKVNVSAFYAWFTRTRLRAAGFVILLLLVDVWVWAMTSELRIR